MTDQIGHYLLEIVKAGGPLALWGVFGWLTVNLVKVGVLCLTAYSVIKTVCNSLVKYRLDLAQAKQSRIHLLSEEVSKKLSDNLDNISLETQAILRDIQRQLDDLRKESAKI